MRIHKPVLKIGEIAFFSLLIGALNLIFVENPGFFHGFFNPYLALALVVSLLYGKSFGFLSLACSTLIIGVALPPLVGLVRPELSLSFKDSWRVLGDTALLPLGVGLLGVYLFGIIRDSYVSRLRKAKDTLRTVSRNKGLLSRQSRTLTQVNQELEERINRQQDSITALYTQIQELYSLSMSKALEAILATVRKFSGAGSASIWEYRAEAKELRLAANLGWESTSGLATVIPVDQSIEGWVARNNLAFSVKMLIQYENLRKMDKGRNLMTFPISPGRKMWGVLNIEEMPFLKYNLYTEKILQLIIALAEPALERAIEYDALTHQAEINQFTGLASFSQFYSLLQAELQRTILQQGTLSVIILELVNFPALIEEYGRENAYSVLVTMIEKLKALSQNKASFFHYKSENQLGLLFPSLDYDGTSLFCLEALEAMNQKTWKLNDRQLFPELFLGYASLGGGQETAEELLESAENLLEMQKL
jgi:GGDEF domain-containing protein